ncbi:hypothetical protein [Spirulina sp. 06S082]|uniref:hypothetical protein n=1 Tax=Spirulina sp. 06S082 TaxID=3110248 RepID=UPI002B215031|nr:hypothetical protein [Spirulina sp. 06S082]MEA5472251.1 hypothetical protein [Spirulina sp. 06S082]
MNHIIELIQELDNRGFASDDFRDRVTSGLKKIAESNDGLPRNILILFQSPQKS